MFKEIGKKIMNVAIAFFYIGIIGFGILGIVTIVLSQNTNDKAAASQMLISGITIIIAGFIVSWIGSVCLYGFGKLIDDNAHNRILLERIAKTHGMQWSCSKCCCYGLSI